MEHLRWKINHVWPQTINKCKHFISSITIATYYSKRLCSLFVLHATYTYKIVAPISQYGIWLNLYIASINSLKYPKNESEVPFTMYQLTSEVIVVVGIFFVLFLAKQSFAFRVLPLSVVAIIYLTLNLWIPVTILYFHEFQFSKR